MFPLLTWASKGFRVFGCIYIPHPPPTCPRQSSLAAVPPPFCQRCPSLAIGGIFQWLSNVVVPANHAAGALEYQIVSLNRPSYPSSADSPSGDGRSTADPTRPPPAYQATAPAFAATPLICWSIVPQNPPRREHIAALAKQTPRM